MSLHAPHRISRHARLVSVFAFALLTPFGTVGCGGQCQPPYYDGGFTESFSGDGDVDAPDGWDGGKLEIEVCRVLCHRDKYGVHACEGLPKVRLSSPPRTSIYEVKCFDTNQVPCD